MDICLVIFVLQINFIFFGGEELNEKIIFVYLQND